MLHREHEGRMKRAERQPETVSVKLVLLKTGFNSSGQPNSVIGPQAVVHNRYDTNPGTTITRTAVEL